MYPMDDERGAYVLHLSDTSTVKRDLPVKTTIILKDELYEHLVKKYGRRKISKTINDVLTNHFSRPKKSRFGVDRWLTVKGPRDEKEPHETS